MGKAARFRTLIRTRNSALSTCRPVAIFNSRRQEEDGDWTELKPEKFTETSRKKRPRNSLPGRQATLKKPIQILCFHFSVLFNLFCVISRVHFARMAREGPLWRMDARPSVMWSRGGATAGPVSPLINHSSFVTPTVYLSHFLYARKSVIRKFNCRYSN